jgi:drug/metabolite transporter (DMT)-like permease
LSYTIDLLLFFGKIPVDEAPVRGVDALTVGYHIHAIPVVEALVGIGSGAFSFPWAEVSVLSWLSVLYVGVMVAAVSHMIWYTAIAKVGPDHVMLALYLVPVFAAVSGTLFLGQPFGLVQIVGAVVALLGVGIVRRTSPPGAWSRRRLI